MNVTILGAGMIGRPMALDLKEFDVTIVDNSLDALNKLIGFPIKTIKKNLDSVKNLREVIAGADIVVNAVPGWLGFYTLEEIIKNGKNVVDIAFYDEDPFQLGSLAIEKNVTAIVDCGVAPGLSNLLVGKVFYGEKGNLHDVKIMCGGLPKAGGYKAPFSTSDVLEIYTRMVSYKKNGIYGDMLPLTDIETVNYDGISELEAFNSDGLRTLIRNIDADNMIEKTLRFPGHANIIKFLKNLGFFDKQTIPIDEETHVSPYEITEALLSKAWKIDEDYEDFTVLDIQLEIKEDEMFSKTRSFFMIDRYDKLTKTTSMARTTGYTATAAVRMLAKGLFPNKGINPLEYVAAVPECTEFILDCLAQRGIKIQEK